MPSDICIAVMKPLTRASSLAFTPAAPLPVASASSSDVSPLRKPRAPHTRLVPVAVQQHVPPAKAVSLKRISSKELLAYLKANKERVDAALEACLDTEDPHTARIVSAMRYSLLAGGKRIRPILAIAAYEMFASTIPKDFKGDEGNDDLSRVMPTALAVEMIHTMSLIHDDLPAMDDDDFRRGKPTNHMVYGEDIAILAGDALLSYAFEFVARKTRGVESRRVVDVLMLLGESVGPRGLAGGQAMDLEHEGSPNVSLDTLTWIHTHKTAALLRVSCACGAIIGGANEEDVRRVTDFAVKVGLAFQIADDVLDVTQSTEVLGKTAGKDVASNKATYPRILGLDASKRQAESLISQAKAALKPYGDRANTLFALADFIIYRQN